MKTITYDEALWQLVPREMTPEMVAAIKNGWGWHSSYTAMLAAAPTPEQPAVEQWQPISTAPRDGTIVDLWHGGEFAGRVADCAWGVPDHCCGEHGDLCDSEWHDMAPGWFDTVMNMPVYAEPTHWTLRPQPPAGEAK